MDLDRLCEIDEDIIHRVRILGFVVGTDSIPNFRNYGYGYGLWMENVDQSGQPGHSRKIRQAQKIPHLPQIPQQTVVHQDLDTYHGDC